MVQMSSLRTSIQMKHLLVDFSTVDKIVFEKSASAKAKSQDTTSNFFFISVCMDDVTNSTIKTHHPFVCSSFLKNTAHKTMALHLCFCSRLRPPIRHREAYRQVSLYHFRNCPRSLEAHRIDFRHTIITPFFLYYALTAVFGTFINLRFFLSSSHCLLYSFLPF